MTSITNIAHSFLSNFVEFVASNLIKMNGKVCIIRRFLCHDIKKPCHIISWSFMSRYVICHDYRGIPTSADSAEVSGHYLDSLNSNCN